MATSAGPAVRTVELAAQLRMAVLRLSRRLRQHAAPDITPSQLSALHVIVREERLTLSQLAEAERVQPPTITRVVDSLVQSGFVTRVPSEEDRRVAFVAPTPTGRALVDTIRRRRDAYLARHLKTFSAADRDLLARAAELLERLTEDPRMTRVRLLGRATFASLRNRNYRLYFTGQVISVSGTWMQRLAQAWLILRLTGNDGVALGVETGLQFLPMLLFGAWGGVLADRFDKRRLLYCTQISAGLLALGLGLVVAFGQPTVLLVYVFSLLLGFTTVIDMPARQTFVMEMVGRDELPNAVGLNSVVMNTSRVVGPAVGGLVIEAIGLAPCFFVNAASYLAVLLALFMMNADALHRMPTVPRARGQLREGFRYVRSERAVRIPLVMMAVIGTLAFNFQVVIPLMSTETFGQGAGGFGVLTAVMGAGAIVGALAAASRRGVSYTRLFSLTFAMGFTILAAALAPTLALEAVALFFMGAASFAFIATANATLQLTARPEMRGRVMALYGIAFLGSTPIGSPIIGWISNQYGPRSAFFLGGVAAILAGAVAMWSFARAHEQDPRVRGVAAPAT